jgi:hypothetical protein
MSDLTVPWDEHLDLVRRVGRLEGAIEAHRILIGQRDIADAILYGVLDDDPMFPLSTL